MTFNFDPFSYLDPVRAEKQIEEGIGHAIFDQFSLLDPARASRQIEVAIGHSVFTPFSALDPAFALAQIVASDGGGGADRLTLGAYLLKLGSNQLVLGA